MKLTYISVKDKPPKSLDVKLWNLAIPQEVHWKKAKEKVLVILQHIASEDLKAGRILGGQNNFECTNNIIEYAKEIAGIHGASTKDVAHTFIGYNYFKTYDLNDREFEYSKKVSNRRIKKLVEFFKPTKILVVGDIAANELLGEMSYATLGCIKSYNGIPATNTIPYDESFSSRHSVSDDDDEEYEEGELSDDSVLKATYLV